MVSDQTIAMRRDIAPDKASGLGRDLPASWRKRQTAFPTSIGHGAMRVC
jgi:hypothetical protein